MIDFFKITLKCIITLFYEQFQKINWSVRGQQKKSKCKSSVTEYEISSDTGKLNTYL